ncbi:MAG: NlpC/P60 family protein [Microbacteriaceae bacterium]|nr:MAG: NlpC/P60 family protein [Microbacteriaceae bacterium]
MASSKSHRTGPLLAFGAVAMGAVTASVGIITPPAFADDYPSWNDVQQAKQNVAQQQALVDKITGLINGLQTQVNAANLVAQKAAEAYLQAQAQLDEATQKAADLQRQADAAAKKAQTSKMRAGLLASHLARTGGQNPSVDLMLNGDNGNAAETLLYQLGTMSKLTQQSQGIYDQAIADKNTAQALTDQAAVARAKRTELATAAQVALTAAKDAQAKVQSALATQKQRSTELVAQLASLKNTSAAVETSYLAGVKKAQEEAAAALAEKQRLAALAASGNNSSSSGGGNSVPNGSIVENAIAFAMAQRGDPYVLGGAGPNVWDCSGLTMMAYSAAGVYIGPHYVSGQYNVMRSEGKLFPYSQRQRGDLLFWYNGGFYHVAIYLGGGMMIAAPTEGDVVKVQPVWGYGGDLMNVVGRPAA